ncbi:MAG: hypothetical protein JNM84_22650 [Planctomycetes bacterium]|nr:hypothetical protein [Planctomycetota bacterium]
MRRLLLRSALVVLSTCGGVLALEVGLQLYARFIEVKVMAADDRFGWVHRPGQEKRYPNEHGAKPHFRTNEYGHRNARLAKERAPGRKRILVLGDSFTEAVQVEEAESFPVLLERALPNVEVLNSGVGGWGTVQQLLYFEQVGRELEPDLVLLMFFGNDLIDNTMPFSAGIAPRPYARLVDGRLEIVQHPDPEPFLSFGPSVPFAATASRHSLVYLVLREYIYQPLHTEELRQREIEWMGRQTPDERHAIFGQALGRLQAACRNADAKLCVALIPSRDAASGQPDAPLELIEELCAQHAAPCLSLQEPLRRSMEAKEGPYFARDIHWTARGHAVAAEALIPWVRERLAETTP